MPSSASEIKVQLSGLKKASSEELVRYWKSAFGRPVPEHLPRHLQAAVLGYRLQANKQGGISKQHGRYLEAIGRLLAQDPQAPIPAYVTEKKQFKPGTVFVREHGGIQHRVVATPEGFLWGNEAYPSLSAVARAITGTNWNGRRFFGLIKNGA